MIWYRYQRRGEARRDRRYTDPVLAVTIAGSDGRTVNWSLGGMLVSGVRLISAPGEAIAGRFQPGGGAQTIEFRARVVWALPDEGRLAVRFEDLSSEALDTLGRTAARRLAGSRVAQG